MKIICINRKAVKQYLTMDGCIESIRTVLKDFSNNETLNPLRNLLWMPSKEGLLISMPGYLKNEKVLGMKIITVFFDNAKSGYDIHQGFILLFDGVYGFPKAIIDATEVTGIRTAAASAVATDLLARKDATSLAIIGTGHQAVTHIEAMKCVRNITSINICSRKFEKAQTFAHKYSEIFETEINPCETVQECVENCDIICGVSSARDPIVKGEWIKVGCHINAVGACTPVTREFDSESVIKSKLYTDSKTSITNEAGEYIIPLNEGSIQEDHLLGEIGDVLNGIVEGRTNDEEITFFKSLGIAVEDLASAEYVFHKCEEDGFENNIDW
eukprot:TRINITY_DN11695_c0_g1_i1.p1 TRINITY_DN11695_c0_g1~~TRINITY_DN11695_c0_g1_i1.p1  ORF type:complete len:328 (+),score=100.26 TRINITY_DN11695_c0_g1_i1:292-1275(+)